MDKKTQFLDKIKEDYENKPSSKEKQTKIKNSTINSEKKTVVKRRKSDFKKQEFQNFAEYQKGRNFKSGFCFR